MFQIIYLFHLFVHLQDFLYCCLLMHKPRPQTHLKHPLIKILAVYKWSYQSHWWKRESHSLSSIFLYFWHPTYYSPPLQKDQIPVLSGLDSMWPEQAILCAKGSAERMEPSRETTVNLYIASLDACVSISWIDNHQLLVLFSLFSFLENTHCSSSRSSPPAPAPLLLAQSPPAGPGMEMPSWRRTYSTMRTWQETGAW